MGDICISKNAIGLSNTRGTFQRAMDHAFGELINNTILIYLDDITVFFKNRQDHLIHLRQIFDKCMKFGIFLNSKKSIFMVNQGKLLGHIMSGEGLAIDPDWVKAIEALLLSSNKKALQSFLSQVNFI